MSVNGFAAGAASTSSGYGSMDFTSIQQLESNLADLELNDEDVERLKSKKEQLKRVKPEDVENLQELGSGDTGVVFRASHKPTRLFIARKMIPAAKLERVASQILQEMDIFHDYKSDYIVEYYGSFYADRKISLLTEFMDGGSLDLILTRWGTIPENALAKIAQDTMRGLTYLRDKHNIMHGNLKPSNILVNSRGQVKLCDIAAPKLMIFATPKTFGWTKCYLPPEYILASQQSVASDVWALGVTLIELAKGDFPIPSCFVQSSLAGKTVFGLVNYMLNKPSPKLPPGTFSAEFEDFVSVCTQKNPVARSDLHAMLNHAWFERSEQEDFDFAGWVQRTMKKTQLRKKRSSSANLLRMLSVGSKSSVEEM